MNYTKTIRKYLEESKGKIFDMGYECLQNFYMIPYNTYFRIIQRLEAEGLVTTLDRETYFIGEFNGDLDELIVSHCAKQGCGWF